MKYTLLFSLLTTILVGVTAHSQQVPDACPVDEPGLLQAVANGQKIICQIDYFTGGRGSHLVKAPLDPNPKESIELACIDAQETGCAGNIMCYESPYIHCAAQ